MSKADYSRPRQTIAYQSILISAVLPASPMSLFQFQMVILYNVLCVLWVREVVLAKMDKFSEYFWRGEGSFPILKKKYRNFLGLKTGILVIFDINLFIYGHIINCLCSHKFQSYFFGQIRNIIFLKRGGGGWGCGGCRAVWNFSEISSILANTGLPWVWK